MNIMKRILFFGYTAFSDRMRAAPVRQELEMLGCECFYISQACSSMKIGEILADPALESGSGHEAETLPEPFILFCGLQGEDLDTAIRICRGNTRAVLTQHNVLMTPLELSEHLMEERKAFENRRQ